MRVLSIDFSKIHIVSYAVFLTAAALILSGCSFEDPLEDFEIRVGMDRAGTIVTGSIIDAATGLPVEGVGVEINISGPGRDKVTNMTNEPFTRFTAQGGFLSFALLREFVPTANTPADITILAHADGYTSTSQRLVITEDGDYTFELRMVNLEHTPPGVSAAVDTGYCDTNGRLLEPVSVATSGSGTSPLAASLSLPQGAILQDRDGNPLTGMITATLVHFDNQEVDALASFPGGFHATIEENGTQRDRVFTTAGFAALDIMDEYGRMAKTIDNEQAAVSLEIPAETLHPETGQPIEAGQPVGIYSYDSETGKWTFEHDATILGPGENGNFYMNFSTEHFSYWNLDWEHQPCQVTVTLENYIGGVITLRMHRGYYSQFTVPLGETEVTLLNLPLGETLTLTAWYEGEQVGYRTITPDCENGITDFPITLEYEQYRSRSATGTVQAWCQDDPDVIFGPTMPVYYRRLPNGSWMNGGMMEEGSVTLPSLVVEQEYEFRGTYDEHTIATTFFVPTNGPLFDIEYEFPQGYCDGVEEEFPSELRGTWEAVSRTGPGGFTGERAILSLYNGGTGAWCSGIITSNTSYRNQYDYVSWATLGETMRLQRGNNLPMLGTWEYDFSTEIFTFTYELNSSRYEEQYRRHAAAPETFTQKRSLATRNVNGVPANDMAIIYTYRGHAYYITPDSAAEFHTYRMGEDIYFDFVFNDELTGPRWKITDYTLDETTGILEFTYTDVNEQTISDTWEVSEGDPAFGGVWRLEEVTLNGASSYVDKVMYGSSLALTTWTNQTITPLTGYLAIYKMDDRLYMNGADNGERVFLEPSRIRSDSMLTISYNHNGQTIAEQYRLKGNDAGLNGAWDLVERITDGEPDDAVQSGRLTFTSNTLYRSVTVDDIPTSDRMLWYTNEDTLALMNRGASLAGYYLLEGTYEINADTLFWNYEWEDHMIRERYLKQME